MKKKKERPNWSSGWKGKKKSTQNHCKEWWDLHFPFSPFFSTDSRVYLYKVEKKGTKENWEKKPSSVFFFFLHLLRSLTLFPFFLASLWSIRWREWHQWKSQWGIEICKKKKTMLFFVQKENCFLRPVIVLCAVSLLFFLPAVTSGAFVQFFFFSLFIVPFSLFSFFLFGGFPFFFFSLVLPECFCVRICLVVQKAAFLCCSNAGHCFFLRGGAEKKKKQREKNAASKKKHEKKKKEVKTSENNKQKRRDAQL